LIGKNCRENVLTNRDDSEPIFYKWASALALITILYNLIEGVVSIVFGIEDGTVALFGFGVDSFVEVISGFGIWHMIRRMKGSPRDNQDRFERTALKVTGTAFYFLAGGLIITALVNFYQGYKPETTRWSIIVGIISIIAMQILIHYKVKVGKRFNSQALLADAACTRTCVYLSVVLLIAGIGYEATGIGLIDSLGAVGIAIFSFKEGREAFGKARGGSCCCGAPCDPLSGGE
jgi:divalent metal cation (Fe/Co/Zn/Cd) transporter